MYSAGHCIRSAVAAPAVSRTRLISPSRSASILSSFLEALKYQSWACLEILFIRTLTAMLGADTMTETTEKTEPEVDPLAPQTMENNSPYAINHTFDLSLVISFYHAARADRMMVTEAGSGNRIKEVSLNCFSCCTVQFIRCWHTHGLVFVYQLIYTNFQ